MATSVVVNPFQKPNPQLQQQPRNEPTPQSDPKASINDPNRQSEPEPAKKQNQPSGGDDPILNFKELWQNDPEDPNNPRKPEETNFLPNIDPVKLQESFGKIDFSKYASPEEVAAIKTGGENAAAAHMSVLNKSMRQAMLTMFTASQRMTEAGLTKAQERFLGKVPGHVKDVLVQTTLTKNSKLMSNPAYAPLIEATRQRFQEKFPKATSDQISEAVGKYLDSFVAEATKKEDEILPDNVKKLKQGDAGADWEEWLTPDLAKSL